MGQCLECGWHAGEHDDNCPAMTTTCKFCGNPKTEQHHTDCPTNAGPGEMAVWDRGYEHGRLGKPHEGYGPHYNMGYRRGHAKLDVTVSSIPPGWS